MKRQRGRGRGGKPGGHHNHHNPNRSLDSSGPDGTKVRGPVAHVYERYLQLARDAASSGDRILSENYMQHADHYFRLWRTLQPAAPVQPQQDRFEGEDEGEGGGAETEGAEDESAEAEASGGQEASDEQQAQQGERNFERGDGEFRRRRGRRSRFRSGEGEQGEEGEARPQREAREGDEPREPRRERSRESRGGDRGEQGQEGFSDGPKPAFLKTE